MPLARLELTISVYNSDTRNITTFDPKDPIPSRYPSYPAQSLEQLGYTVVYIFFPLNIALIELSNSG